MIRSSGLRCGSSSGLRRVPLRRSAPLRSGPVLLPVDVREALERRSGCICEVAQPACLGRAVDPHHRVLRGNGGRRGAARQVSDQLSNLIHTCRACHEWIHEHPAASREAGWMLPGRDNPALAALLVRGVPSYLDDQGGVHAFEAVGA